MLKASLFAGSPLKVTPQQKDNIAITGSRLFNSAVHLPRSLWCTDIRQGQTGISCFVSIVVCQRLHVVRYK
ncbi:hypothetical protein ACR715_19245 [Xenorhabdus bovienii]